MRQRVALGLCLLATWAAGCARRGDVPRQTAVAPSTSVGAASAALPASATASASAGLLLDLRTLAPAGFSLFEAAELFGPTERAVPVGGDDACFRVAVRASSGTQVTLADAPGASEFWPKATTGLSDVFCRRKNTSVVLRVQGSGAARFALFRAVPPSNPQSP